MDKNVTHHQIEGVQIIPLKTFKDDRGMVLHMLKKSSPYFKQFGEIYFSLTNPGIIKGWKLHKLMEQNFVVPSGKIKFVIYDDRQNSLTRGNKLEIELGQDNYQLIKIPPNLWYSFSTTSEVPGLIANCSTIEHDPEEVELLEINTDKIPHKW